MRKLKVLDLFCGAGGWSIPFIKDGDYVVGVDIRDVGYPGKLILKDVRELDGRQFRGFDLIIGSPPCEEFSIAKEFWVHKGRLRNIEKGLELVRHFYRIVEEAQPKFWAMENVWQLTKYWHEKPIWKFRISRRGIRALWGNIPIPLALDFQFRTRLCIDYGWEKRYLRAKIPYPIARFIADCVKNALRAEEPLKAEGKSPSH
mgnify:CR=1 FL=1